MIQAMVKLGEYEDRVLTIIKGKFGLRNKSDAINFVIKQYEQELLEPELRPEYVVKIKGLEQKGNFSHFKSLDALRKELDA